MKVMKWNGKRQMLLNGGLALILALLILLIHVASSESAPPLPEPGALLYVTTFDDFNDEWDLYRGKKSAQVEEGRLKVLLRMGVPNNTGAFSPLERLFSDFDMTVEATQLGGPDDNGYGVVFRHQDEEHFYQFLISGDGYYQITRSNGSDPLEDIVTLNEWRPTDLINLGQDATNHIRIIGRGDTFRFFINGHPLELCLGRNAITDSLGTPICEGGELSYELVDDTFSYGHLGVGAFTSVSGAGVHVGFDNMLVVGPEVED